MIEWLELAAFLALIVGPPFAIGWFAGKRLGGVRGKLAGALMPVVCWTIRLLYNLSLPRSYDYGPAPRAEVEGWIAGSVVAAVIGGLAAAAFERNKVPVGTVAARES